MARKRKVSDLMNSGEITRPMLRNLLTALSAMLLALALVLAPQIATAQDVPAGDAAAENPLAEVAPGQVDTVDAADGSTVEAAPGADAYTPLDPSWIKGAPENGAIGFQDQYTPDGEYAHWMHDAILLPLITVVCLFVLGLLLWVVTRYRRKANPVPSKTSHNTLIEVVWTLVPVLILVAIAVPSITLLARQYEPPAEGAVTVKATGYQWYWGFTYPDNGGFEVISNMLDESDAIARGEPAQAAVDNRMVVPAGEWLRIQTTGADVIHSFGVPSLWFKLDAVPGRLNERRLFINEPGIYYGQCFELCGARHAYMPLVVEALPRPQWEAWVRSQGGTVGGEEEVTPELAPLQEPESSLPGAPGAGAPPTEDTAPLRSTSM